MTRLWQLVEKAIAAGDAIVEADARRIGQYKQGEPVSAHDLANRLFHTVFMGTVNSSADTRSRYDDLVQVVLAISVGTAS